MAPGGPARVVPGPGARLPGLGQRPGVDRFTPPGRLCSSRPLAVASSGPPAYAPAAPSSYGEATALRVLREVQAREERRLKAYEAKKRAHRKEYDIGWNMERIPRNIGLAEKLGFSSVEEGSGLCCLVYDEDAKTIGVTAQSMPAACVNLEYLSLALQVRMHAGREPLFSLDPADGVRDHKNKNEMQKKRFEPEWLMGTSVGEVMWQADYHLKELAFGEFEQPVIGMKSAFDYDEAEGRNKEWCARVWFVVNDAEVYVTDDNVIIPHIDMGVEAREQTKEEGRTIDAKVTREDHPMKKYADSFTRNFDLIAERKSVIYHLRECAKASIIAKFMLEAQVDIADKWFDVVDWSKVKEEATACCLEVPQLWNDRCHSTVELRNGRVVGGEGNISTSTAVLYGGVEFGLGQFTVRNPRALPQNMRAGASLSAVTMAVNPTRGFLSAQMPRGVDFNLDQFDLSDVKRAGEQNYRRAVLGYAFWELLANSGPAKSVGGKCAPTNEETCASKPTNMATHTYSDEEVLLLQRVFNPHISDRRAEGDLFVGPDLSEAYAEKLRTLLDEELKVRRQRIDHFLSPTFMVGDAGPLFPISWTFSLEVTQAMGFVSRAPMAGQADLDTFKKAGNPVFDKRTEDGLRFRIYSYGNLQGRTLQEHDGPEALGAIFVVPEKQGSTSAGGATSSRGGAIGSSAAVSSSAGDKTLKVTVARTAAPQEALSKESKASRKAVPESERKERLASLIYSNGAMRADREVVMAAVEYDGLALERAAESLRGDREIVQMAIQEKGGALQYAAENLRADKEVVAAAIAGDACAIEHASEELRGDRELALSAIKGNSFALKSLTPELRAEREMILAAIQKNAYALEHASQELLEDKDFLLAVVRKNALALEDVPRKMRADHSFMMDVVRSNGFALKYASKELRADVDIVAAAVQQDSRASEYADKDAYRRYLESKG